MVGFGAFGFQGAASKLMPWTVTPDIGGNTWSTVEVMVRWTDKWNRSRRVVITSVRDG